MTLRDDLIDVVDAARGLVVGFDLRPRGVVVRSVTATLGTYAVTETTSDLTLTPIPRVRDLTRNQSQVGGIIEQGDYLVSKISPTYTRAELDPGGDSVWLVDERGDNAVPCRLLKLEQRNFEWRAILQRMDRA